MENRINIAELLKDCPQGMELDCTMFENLEFDHIDKYYGAYLIICRAKTEGGHYNIHTFTEYGCYSVEKYSKVVIFPKGKTTWEGFVPPCKFKDGDIVFSGFDLISIFKGIKNGYSGSLHSYVSVRKNDSMLNIDRDCWTLQNIRLATEEEKEKLFQAIKDNGYKWNDETKTLDKLIEPKFEVGDTIRNKGTKRRRTITKMYQNCYECDDRYVLAFENQDDWELVPNKFDMSTLVPFESKVLVRAVDNQFWRPAIWGVKHWDWDFCCVLGGDMWEQCIPYEGNEHLLGTTDDCDEYYKTWK